MKRYYNNDNILSDPSRLAWNKSSSYNKPINQSINKNYQLSTDISMNNKPLLNQRNGDTIDSFNNEINRLKDMTQDVFDKDKEIQGLKNEIQQLNHVIDNLKKERQKYNDNEVEIRLLNQKLNEQYSLNKELSEIKHELEKMKLEKKEDDKKIQLLKNIIRKLKKENNEKNDSYKNDKLKLMLLKHNDKLNDKDIHLIFIEHKITEETDITKELLEKIL
jgi:chromosome segregation ATPase